MVFSEVPKEKDLLGGPICRSPHSRLAEPMNGGKYDNQNHDPLWVGQPILGLIIMT